MKAKITLVRPSSSPYGAATVIEFEVGGEPYEAIIFPGENWKAKIKRVVKQMKQLRQQQAAVETLQHEIKRLEGQEIEL